MRISDWSSDVCSSDLSTASWSPRIPTAGSAPIASSRTGNGGAQEKLSHRRPREGFPPTSLLLSTRFKHGKQVAGAVAGRHRFQVPDSRFPYSRPLPCFPSLPLSVVPTSVNQIGRAHV